MYDVLIVFPMQYFRIDDGPSQIVRIPEERFFFVFGYSLNIFCLRRIGWRNRLVRLSLVLPFGRLGSWRDFDFLRFGNLPCRCRLRLLTRVERRKDFTFFGFRPTENAP